MKFNELGLSEGLLAELTAIGYEKPTPIQEQTIKLALDGKDVLGQAQTGTGKTAAFGLPTIEKKSIIMVAYKLLSLHQLVNLLFKTKRNYSVLVNIKA